MNAAEVLEPLKLKRDVRAIVGFLDQPSSSIPGLREASVSALQSLKEPGAIKLLLDLLKGGILVSADIGCVVGEVLKAYDSDEVLLSVTEILEMEGMRAAHAAQALGRMGDQRAVESLLARLRDQQNTSARCRRDCVEALGRLGDRRASEMLLWELQYDKNEDVRAHAAIALGQIREAKAVGPLTELINDKHKRIRCATAQSLGLLGDSAVLDQLVCLLNDSDWEVRAAAAEALGKLKDERAVQPLRQALTGVIPVQRAAIEALDSLGRLRSSWPLLDEAEEIIGEKPAAAGVFERDVKLGFGAMLMEVPLGCLFSLGLLLPAMLLASLLGIVVGSFLGLCALAFGFAGAHHVLQKRRASKEGISREIILAVSTGSVHVINRDLKDGKPVSGPLVFTWRRDQVTTMVEEIPGSVVPKLTITNDKQKFVLIPKEVVSSPGASIRVADLLKA